MQHHPFIKTARSVLAFLLREMTTTYGKNPGGYIWAILEPFAGIILLSLVFSLAFRSPALGDNFPLFYATGLLPFLFYNTMQQKVSHTIEYSRALLNYPIVKVIDAIVARALLTSLTQVIVFAAITICLLYFYNLSLILNFNAILSAFALAGLLGLGIGTLNCVLITKFPIWNTFWSILNRPMFIISGILFTLENVPDPYRSYLTYNPLIHIVGLMRKGFYSNYDAEYVSYTYCLIISLISLVLGSAFVVISDKNLLYRR